ncbi:MAG TPA: type II toxin-antitoxin system VapB family antitoxin [Gammaproteobacteria bacterium]|nr:type II toxin-antitoxin system VapB family antitoxin [Gammaproteobacteria bacterium]
MTTNLGIDNDLINAALKVGHHRTKKAAVTAALKEYIQRHRQLEIYSLFGKIEYDPSYNYKEERRRQIF